MLYRTVPLTNSAVIILYTHLMANSAVVIFDSVNINVTSDHGKDGM